MIDERPDISGLSVVLGLLSGRPVAHDCSLDQVALEDIEEPGIRLVLDVVDVPQARLTYEISIGLPTEPTRRRVVNLLPSRSTQ